MKKEILVSRDGIYLVDAFAGDSIVVDLPEGKYNAISYQLGVDSAIHLGGAQDGALDPLNDMYWAWNSGYVNFKLEGISPQAKTDLHRVEYHLGGFAGEQKTMRNISMPFVKPLKLKKEIASVTIQVQLEKLWNENLAIETNPIVIRAGKRSSYAGRQVTGAV